MSGNFALNPPIMGGRMYSPGMVLAPIRSSPLILPRKPFIAWRASRDSASKRSAWESKSRPAGVAAAPRPSRSRSRKPNSSSSARMCSETVGWVRDRASAAREKDPSSATFAKISSCLRSTPASIDDEGPSRAPRRIQVRGALPIRSSVAAASSAAAAPARSRRGAAARGKRASGPDSDHRELTADACALARGARDRRRAVHQLLEVGAAGETGVLVDRHRSLFRARTPYWPPR
jgi:hypothetical protein